MSQNFPRDSSRPSQQQQQNTEVSDEILDDDLKTDERFEDFMKKLGRLAKIKRKKEKKVNTHRSMPRRMPPLKSEPSHFSGDFRKLTLSEQRKTLHQSSPERSDRGGVSPTQRARDIDNSSIRHSDGLDSVQTIPVYQTATDVEYDQLNKAKASEAKLRKKVSDTLTAVAIKVVPLDYVLQRTVARWRYDRLRHGLTTWKTIHNATKAYEEELSTAVHIIQRTGRSYLQALKAKRLEMANKILAVTALQRLVRGRLARHAYRHMKIISRLDKLQAYARRYLASRRVKRLLRLRLVELLKVLAPLGRLSRLHAALKSMGKRQNQVRSALQMTGKAQRYRVRQLCRACIHMRAVAVERKVAVGKQKMKRHQQRAARQDAEAKQLKEADKHRRKVYEKRERQRLVAEQRLAAQREIDANKAQAKRLRASEKHRKQVAEQRLAQLLEARKRRSKNAQYQTVFKDLVHLGDATEKLIVHVYVKRSKLTGEAQITVSDPEQKACAVSLAVSLPEEVSGEYRSERGIWGGGSEIGGDHFQFAKQMHMFVRLQDGHHSIDKETIKSFVELMRRQGNEDLIKCVKRPHNECRITKHSNK